MMTMWFPIILVLILLAIAAALLVVLVRSCTLPRRVAKGPCCGQCGYSFTGWSICPECGSAVTDVGVETPRMALRYRGSVALAACVLFLLVLFGGLTTWGVGLAVFDQLGYGRRSYTVTLVPITQSGAQPNYFAHVEAHADTGPNDMLRAGDSLLAIEIAPPTAASPKMPNARTAVARGCPHIRLNLANYKYTLARSDAHPIHSDDKLDAAALRAFLVECGVNLSQPQLDQASEALLRTLRSGQAYTSSPPTTSNDKFTSIFSARDESSYLGPASPVRLPGFSSFATWTLIVAIAFVVLFILALRFVIRRRRRLLAAPVTRAPATPTPPAPEAPHAHS
ncbi:MAG: hypothetical protein K2W85_01845 [Phycisphaerales bacterium]|nr:hypothetical protein [Phycisphaerales bacterium]